MRREKGNAPRTAEKLSAEAIITSTGTAYTQALEHAVGEADMQPSARPIWSQRRISRCTMYQEQAATSIAGLYICMCHMHRHAYTCGMPANRSSARPQARRHMHAHAHAHVRVHMRACRIASASADDLSKALGVEVTSTWFCYACSLAYRHAEIHVPGAGDTCKEVCIDKNTTRCL